MTASSAAPAAINGFLARAKLATEGTFTVTYDVAVRYIGGAVRRLIVTAAQRSSSLLFYRERPSLELSSPNGAPESHGFEVFEVPRARTGRMSGLYSCTEILPASRWTCRGPITGMGMGGVAELLGPYPPQSLLLGLDNAAEAYSGLPTPPAITPEPAFLTMRRQMRCLGFGSRRLPVGQVCLDRNGLIASYEISPSASYGAYYQARLTAYSPRAPLNVFTPP